MTKNVFFLQGCPCPDDNVWPFWIFEFACISKTMPDSEFGQIFDPQGICED